MKLGVVGFGLRGQALFGLATRAFPVEAAAVCDPVEANLAAAQQAYPRARRFSAFDQMLDEVRGQCRHGLVKQGLARLALGRIKIAAVQIQT